MRYFLVPFLAVCAARSLPGQDAYDVQDLGSAAGTYSDAYSINEAGQIAGATLINSTDWQACIWDHGTLTLLPQPPNAFAAYGFSINAGGDVAGFDDQGRALLWSGGVLHVLPGLGGTYHGAYALNDAGQVVGHSTTAAGDERAFLWQLGGIRNLGTLGGSYSDAFAVNQLGQVAGGSGLPGGEQHAFLWENGQMHDLGTLGGRLAIAYGINDNGATVGTSWVAGPRLYTHAFLRNAAQMADLGTLEGPTGNSTALDVNNLGQVVGHSTFPGAQYPQTHAFLYQNGLLQDLNDLIPPGSGWVLESATAINDSGEIVGYGEFGAGPWQRAFVLLPRASSLQLSGPTPGTAGISNTLVVQGATPSALVWFTYGIHAGRARVPGCPGLTLGIRTPNISPPQTADAAGMASYSLVVPPGAAGRTVLFRALELNTCRVSNLVSYRF